MLEGPARSARSGIAVPGLIVLDVSWSMAGDLDRASAALERFRSKLRQNGMTSSNAYLGIVDVRRHGAHRPAADARRRSVGRDAADQPRAATARTSTLRFSEALAAYRAGLAAARDDRRRAEAADLPPSVFFVTDGEHNTGGDWTAPLAELKSRSWKPNVFGFGYRDADPATIREIADEGMAYFAKQGEDPDTMLEKILEVILRSMVSATVTRQRPGGQPRRADDGAGGRPQHRPGHGWAGADRPHRLRRSTDPPSRCPWGWRVAPAPRRFLRALARFER